MGLRHGPLVRQQGQGRGLRMLRRIQPGWPAEHLPKRRAPRRSDEASAHMERKAIRSVTADQDHGFLMGGPRQHVRKVTLATGHVTQQGGNINPADLRMATGESQENLTVHIQAPG